MHSRPNCRVSWLISWYFEPSQPQQITSGVKQTSVCLLFTMHTSHRTTNSPKSTKSVLTRKPFYTHVNKTTFLKNSCLSDKHSALPENSCGSSSLLMKKQNKNNPPKLCIYQLQSMTNTPSDTQHCFRYQVQLKSHSNLTTLS